MKKLFFILIIFTISIATTNVFANGRSNFKRCNIKTTPKISITSSYGVLKYDYTKNTKEITKISGFLNKTTVGLAKHSYTQEVGITSKTVKTKNGYCVIPTNVSVYIGISDPTIYVTRDYDRNSCDFVSTLRHEETHMQINIRIFEHFLNVLPDAMEKISQDIKPVFIKSEKDALEAREQIKDEYVEIVNNFINQMQKERNKEHEKLDGPRGQKIDSKVCK